MMTGFVRARVHAGHGTFTRGFDSLTSAHQASNKRGNINCVGHTYASDCAADTEAVV